MSRSSEEIGRQFDPTLRKALDLVAGVVADAVAPLLGRLDAQDAQLRSMAEDLIELRARLADRKYQGVWSEGGSYQAENSVTFKGSVWIAIEDTDGRPGECDEWVLAVKRGRDAR